MAIVPNLNGVPVSPTTPLSDPHNASYEERLISALKGENPQNVYHFQVTASTTRAHVPPVVLSNGIIVTNDPDSSVDCFVGGENVTVANGYKLKPGQSTSYPVDDAQRVFCITSAGTTTLYITGN